jgi:hypothetical protein
MISVHRPCRQAHKRSRPGAHHLWAGYRMTTVSRVWRARDVARAERVYYMRHAAADVIVPLDLRYENKEEDFPAGSTPRISACSGSCMPAPLAVRPSAPRG